MQTLAPAQAQPRQLPEPFAVTIEATRPQLPEPFTVTIEATRPQLPEPFTVTIEATRPQLPEPFIVTVEATRPGLPEPFTVTIEATRPTTAADCEHPRKDLIEARSLADKGSLAAARQALDKIKRKQCPELAPQIDGERTRISGLVDNAIKNAEAALDACSFEDSRNLIGNLPEGLHRAALVERWNKTYEVERRVRDLLKEAEAFRDEGKPGKAIDTLHQARGLTRCDSVAAVIDNAIAEIKSRIADADAGRAEAALNACQFKDSRELIDLLPQGALRTALLERWNKAYEAERGARDLLKEAEAFRERGKPETAVDILKPVSYTHLRWRRCTAR